MKVNTVLFSAITSDQLVDTFDTTFGSAAFFEYYVVDDGSRARMGQVYAVWDASSGTGTDVSSPDLNGSTANLSWKVQVTGSNVELIAVITGGVWDIKVATRIIL
jgi:hypothetical protein